MAVRADFLFVLFMSSLMACAQPLKTSCPSSCGNVRLDYPFGIGKGCYLESSFSIICNQSYKPSKPFLEKLDLEVLNIWVANNTVRVNHPTFSNCSTGMSQTNISLGATNFFFSDSENKFVARGCSNLAVMDTEDGIVASACWTTCFKDSFVSENSCNGINCCQSRIPPDVVTFSATLVTADLDGACASTFLVEDEWFQHVNVSHPWSHVPVILGWWISKPLNVNYHKTFSSLQINSSVPLILSSVYQCSNRSRANRKLTFNCSCQPGFHGNPYLSNGCKDIDECGDLHKFPCEYKSQSALPSCHNTFGSYKCEWESKPVAKRSMKLIIALSTSLGMLVLLLCGWLSYMLLMKKMRKIKQKKEFFKRNGGLLLQEKLSSPDTDVENIKLFSSQELENATEHFSVNRILGKGGQGTVYKAILSNGKIVAVKKFKAIDGGKLQEFINEVLILSQINHRNVVKLLGFCLETEVPLLIYEYVPNGSLSQYLEHQSENFPLTWDIRLQIATEVAEALYYLHSAASSPIYHRDIKSANILLDDKYRAKVADFGTSRSITIDQTHLTTQVQGTFGYLDPEYFYLSRFTDKSDVYSFGVVLAELLTGEKAISSTRIETSLVKYFNQSSEEAKLIDILDSQVLKENNKNEMIAVANLAKRCLSSKGRRRPKMKEVTMELQAIQISGKGLNIHHNHEEPEHSNNDMDEPWDLATTSTFDVDGSRNFFAGENSWMDADRGLLSLKKKDSNTIDVVNFKCVSSSLKKMKSWH